MNEQLLLFEEPRSSLPVYSLVLAVFPDENAIRQIDDLGKLLRKMHGLSGKTRPNGRLHVSLPLPRGMPRAPEKAVAIISRACKAIAARTRPFVISFDQAVSFPRGRENHPLVLVNNNHGNEGIVRLHGMLCAAFAQDTPQFRPHLTLIYDRKEVPSGQVEPVCWTVREIVLALGELRAKSYHRLGRWFFGG